VPCLHGHSGLPIIFNRFKYDRIFPWPVINVVTFGLKVNFTASLLSTLGKNSLVQYVLIQSGKSEFSVSKKYKLIEETRAHSTIEQGTL
jgi:hypothetical protein